MTLKDNTIKIVFAGDTNVGKTTIIEKSYNNNINNITSTIGACYTSKISKNKRVLSIWDTAGQERFKALTKQYFRNAHICVLVFDLNNLDSFKNIKDWYLLSSNNHYSHEFVPFYVLVGNKTDKIKKMSYTLINNLCSELNIDYFFETNGLSGSGIVDLFNTLEDISFKINIKQYDSSAIYRLTSYNSTLCTC